MVDQMGLATILRIPIVIFPPLKLQACCIQFRSVRLTVIRFALHFWMDAALLKAHYRKRLVFFTGKTSRVETMKMLLCAYLPSSAGRKKRQSPMESMAG